MIFDSYNESSTVSLDAIKESPYPLGYEGALMHVYENELNYYSLMKAVGLSEMKYYQETGKELFLNEAGAFGSFIEKVKAFFKKVIEKIKSIFKKFIAAIDQYTLENKKFVKKYGQEIMRKNLTDFEFEGYKFSKLDTAGPEFTAKAKAVDDLLVAVENSHDSIVKGTPITISSSILSNQSSNFVATMTTDQKTAVNEYLRAALVDDTKRLDTDDYRDRLQELFYGDGKDGDKETLEKINMREQLNYIDDSKKTIKQAERDQKTITKHIENALRKLDKLPNEIRKYVKDDSFKTDMTTMHTAAKAGNSYDPDKEHPYSKDGSSSANPTADEDKINNYIKTIDNILDASRSVANDITVGFGVLVQAYKDRVTQAKAICVKALSYKHESAMVSESYSDYDSDDIFSSVNII